MEGRRVFEHLTVDENLIAGAHTRRRADLEADLDGVYDRFPDLVAHRRSTAGYLSGGQQQMLAIGRALMARPTRAAARRAVARARARARGAAVRAHRRAQPRRRA